MNIRSISDFLSFRCQLSSGNSFVEFQDTVNTFGANNMNSSTNADTHNCFESNKPVSDSNNNKEIKKSGETKNHKKVYISYNWSADKEDEFGSLGFATRLYEDIKTEYVVQRDKENCLYRQSLPGFMNELGSSIAIIIIITEEYFKSENCLNELEIICSSGEASKRIFPIIASKANFASSEARRKIKKHWHQRILAFNADFEELGEKPKGRDLEDLKRFTRFKEDFSDIVDPIISMNYGTPKELQANNFKMIKDELNKWFGHKSFNICNEVD